jgi:hypothetical protein
MKTLRDCASPFNWVAVDSAGALRCCCHSRGVVGNVAETDFDTIWHGPEMARIRNAIGRNSFSPYCKGAACDFAINAQARIAEHGGPLHPGLVIDFGMDGNALDYTTAGWSLTEANFTWTVGKRATLKLGAVEQGTVRTATIDWRAFADQTRHQTVDMLLGGRQIGGAHLADSEFCTTSFPIPWLVRHRMKKHSTELEFRLHSPHSPQSIVPSSNDDRLLGVAVRQISFH